MPETMKLFGGTKKNNKENKKWRKKYQELIELVLVQCNLVDNQYQQK